MPSLAQLYINLRILQVSYRLVTNKLHVNSDLFVLLRDNINRNICGFIRICQFIEEWCLV